MYAVARQTIDMTGRQFWSLQSQLYTRCIYVYVVFPHRTELTAGRDVVCRDIFVDRGKSNAIDLLCVIVYETRNYRVCVHIMQINSAHFSTSLPWFPRRWILCSRTVDTRRVNRRKTIDDKILTRKVKKKKSRKRTRERANTYVDQAYEWFFTFLETSTTINN